MKIRPVRLPPCAAGARPRISTRAAGSPKPGIGRPQYVPVAIRRPLLARDLLAPLDETGAAAAVDDRLVERFQGGHGRSIDR